MQTTAHPTDAIQDDLLLHALLKVPNEHKQRLRSVEPLSRYLYEEYLTDDIEWARKAYYLLKPLIPRAAQLALRRLFTSAQQRRTFPAWPIESYVVDLVRAAIAGALPCDDDQPLLGIAPWPDGASFAFCVTHDVEWDSGLRLAPAVRAIEEKLGVHSSWNLVPERYPIDWLIVEELRQSGAEIGIHGLKHDGKLFNSLSLFRQRLKEIERYAHDWGAVGFRSPSCLRNAQWMREMSFDYDTSFPDTDPYEPQPGGCCSVWPYFIGSMVELPLTMPQDHTIYEILGHDDLRIWEKKANWLASVGGLVQVNVHPDYMTLPNRLLQYEEFLTNMMRRSGIWHALPRDIAGWWRDRDNTTILRQGNGVELKGPARGRGRVVTLGNSVW